MTATLERPQARDGRGGRSIVSLVAVGVVVVTIVGLTAVFGVHRPPELASIVDRPDPAPPEAVAWTSWQDDETCVHLADPAGTLTAPWCSSMGGELVGWTASGEVVLRTWEGGGQLRILDPGSGALTGRLEEDGEASLPEGDAVWSERDGDDLVVRDLATDGELWRVAAPERYTIESSGKTADGDWIVMVDSAERLLVMPADGAVAPRVWADDVPAWPAPVWRSVTVAD